MSYKHNTFTVDLGPSYKNCEVEVSFQKHKFLFGCNGFGFIGLETKEETEQYKTLFTKLFNMATLPFYLAQYEPKEGKTKEKELSAASHWASNEGIILKGHPLCWHTLWPEWMLQYDTKTIYSKTMARIEREVSHYKGTIDMWDVINEVVILPRFQRYDNGISRLQREYGAENLAFDCFKKAKEVNPDATLLINDFLLISEYKDLITRLLDRGCPIDVIGLQTHQHQGYLGLEAVQELIDTFGTFKLPLHFTENTLLSGRLVDPAIEDLNDAYSNDWPSTEEGEQRQAKQIEEMYRLLYESDQVEALIWWDLQDGNWLNAPSGLVRKDYSLKPAYQKLDELINIEWGYPQKTLVTNEKGQLDITGPEGDYSLNIKDKIQNVCLSKDSL
ncbi:endo-1,4-beta-xylanase [Spirochaeta cellobiosiphila]|uniref:endo-1,4-beta-xylanase n=1 Tax=Spirochaeta cellobiosiphila TaxID=504483 RepID=UPI0004282EF3|nr:endo-1,4-beta-xylanase [Spirochaeta cellobiosiphila]